MKKTFAKTICLLSFLSCVHSTYAQTDSSYATKKTKGAQFNFINNDRGHDFDGVLKNTIVSYQVQFKNSGDEPLIITDMHSASHQQGEPPYGVTIQWPRTPVKPGKKGVIVVTLTAKNDIGSFKNELLVTSNATAANYPLLLIVGAIIPDMRHADYKIDPDGWFSLLVPIIANTGK